MQHLKTIGKTVYRIYDWKAKVMWYYDLHTKMFFVDPKYEQKFLHDLRRG